MLGGASFRPRVLTARIREDGRDCGPCLLSSEAKLASGDLVQLLLFAHVSTGYRRSDPALVQLFVFVSAPGLRGSP